MRQKISMGGIMLNRYELYRCVLMFLISVDLILFVIKFPRIFQ